MNEARRRGFGMPVTVLLIVANIAVFAWMTAVDNRFEYSPGQLGYLVQWGANVGGLSFTGEPWRLFTSMFLHGGLWHLGFNALALFEIGSVVERRLGAVRTLLLYLLAGLAGSFASASWHDFTVSVGASGAIFGLLAAVVVFGFFTRGGLPGPGGKSVSPWRALLLGAFTIGLGLFFDFDNAAHLGGFAVGLLLSLFALLGERLGGTAVRGIVFGLGALGMGGALAALTDRAYDPALAMQVHFAQLNDSLRAGNADTRAYLRRCALVAVGDAAQPVAAAFADCLKTQSVAAPLDYNRREVWPACRSKVMQLQRQGLPADRSQLVGVIERYCDARARIEASAVPGSPPAELPYPALRDAILRMEILLGATEPTRGLNLRNLPDSAGLRAQARVLADWRASLDPVALEYARLDDCPFISCRRSWAR